MDPVNNVAADAPEKAVLRGPGLLESVATSRHALGFYTAICCSARFITASSTPTGNTSNTTPIPTLSLLYTALHEVIDRHPALSVSIIDESSPSARFVRLASIDLERLVHVETLPASADEVTRQRALNDLIEDRLSTRFSDLGVLPLWRLVVFLPENEDANTPVDIALFIHHGIADGGSAVMFMQTLLNALNKASARQESLGTVVPPSKSPLLPPLEQLHSLPVSWSEFLWTIWRMWFPASRVGLWTGEPVSRPADVVQTRHAIRVLSPEKAAGLIAACRAHKTTVTPLLEALAARALFASLPTDGTAEVLKASCPINLRGFLPDLKDDIGVFVAGDSHEFKRQDMDVWKEAKRVGDSLTRTVDAMKQGKNFGVGILRYVGDMRKYYEGKVGKPRGNSFEVSNTGAIDGSGGGEGPWRISQLLFSQSGTVTGEAVTFSVSSVRGGPMVISVPWIEDVMDETFINVILDKLVSLVDDVCSGKL